MNRTFTGVLLSGMKYYLSLCLCCFLLQAAYAQQSSYTNLPEKVNYRSASINASALLQQLQASTGYTFSFDYESLTKIVVADVHFNNIALGKALEFLHDRYGLLFSVVASRNISVQAGAIPVKAMGEVNGQVLDAKTNDPIIGATIQTGKYGAVTDINGQYHLELPPGTYTLSISSIGYTTKKITDVVVTERKPLILPVALSLQKSTLKGVEVVASAKKETVAALYLRQKNNAALSDGISAEQIRVTPDNNAAQVLKRVSGLTIQDDKFVTVRGLSDRYNNVVLNGATLPSTEPNRRNFSFDIIPSGLIDNIVVNKTATPDMPAEFAGGLVQVNTRDLPEANYFQVGAGGGYNTNTVGRSVLGTVRGDKDYLGFDDGRRTWWKDKWDRFEYARAIRANDYNKMGEMNQRIPNNWGIYKYKYTPQQSYQLNLGRRFALPNKDFIGLTAGVIYRHEEHIEDEERRTNYGRQFDFKGTTNVFKSSLGGILNLAYQGKGYKIALKNVYNHLFSNETVLYTGPIAGFGREDDINRNYTSMTIINNLLHNRLEGEHSIGKKGIRLDWSGDMINTKRDQPDTRYYMGFRSPNDPEGYYTPYLGERNGFLGVGTSLFNSELKEKRYNWATNITIPFMTGAEKQKIKMGYAGTYRDADFTSVGLLYAPDPMALTNPKFGETDGLPEYTLFGPDYMKPGYLFLDPTGPNGNGGAEGEEYSGIQRLHAGYLMLDASFLKKFRFTGGVRLEQNRVEVNTRAFNPVNGYSLDSLVVYDKKNWLPSANLIYSLTDKMNIRLAYSQTLSRPDFRERSSFVYYEFKERTTYNGAKALRDALITNMDLRYEYYISANEIFSVSGFYKKFDSPVELVAGGTASGQVYYYFNLRSSTAYGAEVDFRKSLGFINPQSTFLNNLFISGNATWMKANVKYNTQEMLAAANNVTGGSQETLPPDSRNRPLQGLSPYVYNAGIGYFGKPVGLNLSYNRYGRRIVAGGLYPYADQYENPRDVLDLQISTRLLRNKLEMRLNISDLLQQPFIIYDNISKNGVPERTDDLRDNVNDDPKGTGYNADLDYTRYRSFRGSNISLNLGYTF